MLKIIDTIDGSGYPLGFCVQSEPTRSNLMKNLAGEDALVVECRAMGDHQKEAIVTEGANGSSWRMTSDEGPYLNGTDLAPFPLGFFNLGLQADLIGRIQAIATQRKIQITQLEVELDNAYSFSGSFFKGTGQGSADGVEIRIRITSNADADTIRSLIEAASNASPAIAALRTPLENTFAIYVNGLRREVIGMHACNAPDVVDPFKKYQALPVPNHQVPIRSDLIYKIPYEATEKMEVMPSSSEKLLLRIKGKSTLDTQQKEVTGQTWLERPVGSLFGFKSDEVSQTASQAPSGLAYLSAGIAFCYMTQLLRYAEYLKYKISDIRIVQINPFGLSGSLVGNDLQASAAPVQTHLFLNGQESDEVMQNLLTMGAKTCYLHAALGCSLEPQIRLWLNESPLDA